MMRRMTMQRRDVNDNKKMQEVCRDEIQSVLWSKFSTASASCSCLPSRQKQQRWRHVPRSHQGNQWIS